MALRKKFGRIALISLIGLGLAGCSKGDNKMKSIEAVKRTEDAYIIYGDATFWASDGIKDRKMIIKYDNGLTLRIYDSGRDGTVNYVNASLDKQKAQELYDLHKLKDKEE